MPLTMRKTAHPSHSGCNHWLPRFPLTSRSEIRCPPLSFGHSACLEDCGSIWNSYELLHLLIFSLHGLEWLSHLCSGFWEWYAPELQGGEAMVAQICRVLVGLLLECRVHRWYYKLGTFWKHRWWGLPKESRSLTVVPGGILFLVASFLTLCFLEDHGAILPKH